MHAIEEGRRGRWNCDYWDFELFYYAKVDIVSTRYGIRRRDLCGLLFLLPFSAPLPLFFFFFFFGGGVTLPFFRGREGRINGGDWYFDNSKCPKGEKRNGGFGVCGVRGVAADLVLVLS